LERYKQAWERRDPAAAKALFSPDARYQETPFDEEMRGAEAIAQYWERETSRQRDVHFSADLLAISGAIAVAHWRASFFQRARLLPSRSTASARSSSIGMAAAFPSASGGTGTPWRPTATEGGHRGEG